MAVTFKQQKTGDADLDLVQQNVAAAFREVASATTTVTVAIARTGQYRAAGTEDVIFVDQSGGPVTVVLPEAPKRPLTVRSISKAGNAITITAPGVQPAGTAAKIGVGTADPVQLVTIAPLGLLRLAFDGSTWWSV
jgi:hypothetical protein